MAIQEAFVMGGSNGRLDTCGEVSKEGRGALVERAFVIPSMAQSRKFRRRTTTGSDHVAGPLNIMTK